MSISSPRSTRTRRPPERLLSNVSNRRRAIGLLEVRLIRVVPLTTRPINLRFLLLSDTKAAALINALIEFCFQPRCVLSPMDADFCVQFVRVMHLQGTPGFWTLTCYDRVRSHPIHLGDNFNGLPLYYQLLGDHVKNIVFSCSEYEARNYGMLIDSLQSGSMLMVMIGRFLLGLLTDLLKWHQDEQQYLQDNRVKGAGKAAYLPGLQLRWTNKPTVAVSDLAKWSEVQQFNRKCHRKLTKVQCYHFLRNRPW